MLLTVVFLVVLFVVGLINIFFDLPTNKFYAWFGTFFSDNSIKSSTASPSGFKKEKNVRKKAELEKVFATFDKNGDGFITKQELGKSLKNIGIFMTDKDIDEIVVKLDANGDGLIDFDEFCLLSESIVGQGGGKEEDVKEGSEKECGGEEELKEAFDVFDSNRDGLISVEELGLVLSSLGLKEGMKIEDCKEMIRKVDIDGDGMVNFSEFKRMMEGGGKLVLAA